ncbi:MAG: hypothetical protein L0I06_06290, partial [Acidipropionibacterium jensenii]|nr:hypothetical protein [Acidipropionibacterium jensenii]
SGSVTLPLAVDTTMIDGAVWVPWSGPVGPRSGEPPIHEALGVLPGSPVELSVASSSITTQGGAE